MKVLIIGSTGQLGIDASRAFSEHHHEVGAIAHEDIEIANLDSVLDIVRTAKPDLIVNTAAMHNVEACEQNPAFAYAVNGIGSRNLAVAAEEVGAALMHVSTDYVFDGKKGSPYQEDDLPCPLSVYGNTKLAGEYFVRSMTGRHFIVRTSALYGENGCRAKKGLNFIQLMLKLAKERDELRVVDSEIVSPTWTRELARQMVALGESGAYGLYHATPEGSCSWFELAQTIFKLTGTRANLQVARPNEFPAKVPRPSYSVLENRALKNEDLNLFGVWQDSLRQYLGLIVTN
jgi:dTDP-4-dehydrorhamnose reductase